MPYQLYCNNELIGTSTSAPLIQDYAQQHSGSIDHLLWEYEPGTPNLTIAEYAGRHYRIEITPPPMRSERR